MKTSYSSEAVASQSTDLLVFAVSESAWSDGAHPHGLAAVDDALGGWLLEAARDEEFKAKEDSAVVVRTHGKIAAKRVALLGVGSAAAGGSGSETALRSQSAMACRLGERLRAGAVHLVASFGGDADAGARAVRYAFEGAALATYRFVRYRRGDDARGSSVEQFGLTLAADAPLSLGADALARSQAQAHAAAQGISLARDLVNDGPNSLTPVTLAEAAAKVAEEEGLECTILDKAAIEERDMQLLLAVNAGSDVEPRLIHLVYRPDGATDETPSVAIVGKGITFDAGGYNLKPGGAIDDMKLDMAGAAAVVGTMKAVSAFAPNVIVHGIVPSAENLVNGSAMKLADVYMGHNGKSVEIRNTDAEGRLILADALGYALEQNVSNITTLATLTGACVVALGPYTAGIFSNRDELSSKFLGAAGRVGEDAWHLPLAKKLRSQLKSDVADMKNVGERWGGAITAALFLEEFVDDKPWVHVDLAGPSFIDKPVEAHMNKGGTGYGVLTLLEYVSSH